MRKLGVVVSSTVLVATIGLVGLSAPMPAAAASPPTLSVAPAHGFESVGPKPGSVRFAVTLSDPSTTTVTVDWTVTTTGAPGAATLDDFVKTSGTLTFKPSARTGLTATTKFVSVRAVPDAVSEPAEQFDLQLSNPSTGHSLDRDKAVGTIVAPTGTPTITALDGYVVEGDTGFKNTLKLPVTLGAPLSVAATFDIAVAVGSATPAVDYKAVRPKTVTFRPGQTQKTVSLAVFPDTAPESDEIVRLDLTNPTGGATIATPTVTATILNDDATPPPGFVVNTPADSRDATPGDGVCLDSAGLCSLRAAVDEINAEPPNPAVIELAASPELSIAGRGDDRNARGDIDIRVPNVEIRGNGHTVDANGIDRVLHASTGLTVTDTTITGGDVTATGENGGGILAAPSSRIEYSTITDNAAVSGGGIAAGGELTVIGSSIASNRANTALLSGAGAGGGVWVNGPVHVTASTMTGNRATAGGALYATSPGLIEIEQSTFTMNQATIGAAVVLVQIYNAYGARISGSTFVSNSGTAAIEFTAPTCSFGPVCPPPPGVLTVTRTVIAGSSGCTIGTLFPPSVQSVVDGGSNLISNGGACAFGNPADPLLGPLSDNGGPTQTHLPLAGSPAIDGGAACTGTDQRGVSRPQGNACDIGAVEVMP